MTAIPPYRLNQDRSSSLVVEAQGSLSEESEIQNRRNTLDFVINPLADAIFQIVVATAAGAVAAKAFTRSSDLEQGLKVGALVGVGCHSVWQLYHCLSQRKERASSRVIRVIVTLAAILFAYPIVVAINEDVKGGYNSTDSGDSTPIFG